MHIIFICIKYSDILDIKIKSSGFNSFAVTISSYFLVI